MRRWLFLILAVVLSGWFPPTASRAYALRATPNYDAAATVEKIVVGVGITMDTYEGRNEDPGSLHKYLYCQGNPVNMTDPSGYDGDEPTLMGTMTGIAYMAANVAIRAAPALTRVTVVIFEATTGESITIGGGAAITGYAAMSRVSGGIGSWSKAVSSLKGVVFGPYGYVKSLIKGTGVQAHHLNQSGAYTAITRQVGACVELDANALIKGTEHNQFHAVLEQFWDQYRKSDKKASNQEYLQALRSALEAVKDSATGAAKFTKKQIDAMVEFAENEQKGYGYHDGPGGMKPETPKSMSLDY